MSLEDVIESLFSDEAVQVTRRAGGAMVDGIWVPGATSTFVLPFASIQPATGMARVVGGRDMRSDELGQHTDDVRVVYSNVELKTRELTSEPDQIFYEGGMWVATRAEKWKLNDEVVWRTLITRETRGGA